MVLGYKRHVSYLIHPVSIANVRCLYVQNLDLLGGAPYMILTNSLRVSLATILLKCVPDSRVVIVGVLMRHTFLAFLAQGSGKPCPILFEYNWSA